MGRRPRNAEGDGAGMTDRKHGRDTRIVKGGRRKEWTSRIVNPPVYRASTILFDDVAALRAAKPEHGVFYYGRQGTPTTWALAEALTELEPGAAGTRLFPSGRTMTSADSAVSCQKTIESTSSGPIT